MFDQKVYMKKYYAENREKMLEYHKKCYDKHSRGNEEFYEKNREKCKKYYAKNKDKMLKKHKEWYDRTKEQRRGKHNTESSEYYYRNKTKINEKNRKYAKEHRSQLTEMGRRRRKLHPEKDRCSNLGRCGSGRGAYKYGQRLKLKVFLRYSPELKCACCGESKFEFLTLDHIEGRKAWGHGRELRSNRLYLWIVRNNYPKGFQVLCYNCNCAKGLYGECPHKSGKTILSELAYLHPRIEVIPSK